MQVLPCSAANKEDIEKYNKLLSCMNFLMIEALIAVFRRETDRRIKKENPNGAFCYNFTLFVFICGHAEIIQYEQLP